MNKIISITSFFLMVTGCSHQSDLRNPPSGDIAYGSDPYTYQASYNGKEELRVGDKVRIMQYDFEKSQKEKQSRNFPLSTGKKQIGEAVVSNVFSPHYYELKTDQPKPLPGNAFIEKF